MRRREFIAGLVSGAVWPVPARAQRPERMRRIGMLMTIAESDSEARLRIAALVSRLAELGWADGRNVRIEYRWPGADRDRIGASARELVTTAPDVIFAHTPSGVVALQEQTRDIPIVFVQVADPVEAGIVTSLARPGGNATGFTNFEYEIGGKWVQLLKEIAPMLERVSVVHNPDNPSGPLFMRVIETAASSLGIQSVKAALPHSGEDESIVNALLPNSRAGLIVLPDVAALAQREYLISLAARHRLPAIYPYRFYSHAGGLMSYGADITEQWRQAAIYLNRILRGEKPADLPIQNPIKYELVINIKTARGIGVDVPPMLLARADEVIQ